MAEDSGADGGRDWTHVAVPVVVTLAGACLLGGLVVVGLTGSVSRAEYEAYSDSCGELDGETRLVEDGIGMEPVKLNRSHVRACENTSYAGYVAVQRQSMQSTPLNRAQWLWYGGFGVFLTVFGALFVRYQLRVTR